MTKKSTNAPSTLDPVAVGQQAYDLIVELFPLCRSITGDGVRETLRIINKYIPLKMHEITTGTQALDWVVPKEWNIRDAYILDEHGKKIVDFKKNNLHVVSYSVPVDTHMPLSELQKHLHSLESQPNAIPYVTSYYQERWGFCMTHRERAALKEGTYRVYIDSELKEGSLTYGECTIPGKTTEEVFLSTYVCHPSLANNELSGPAVATKLAQWIKSAPRRYTYRIVFIPEMIGSACYVSQHLDAMKKNIIAGFILTCVGDDRAYSFLPSRNGGTLADKVAVHVLTHAHPDFFSYSYLDRGSDERQYCSAGVDLPVVSVMRSKYDTYPEYHTSLDDLSIVSPSGLQGSYDVLKECVTLVEENQRYRTTCLGEPQLGKRGLYPSLGAHTKETFASTLEILNFIAYSDGTNDVVDIANKINVPAWKLYTIIEKLQKVGLIEPENSPRQS